MTVASDTLARFNCLYLGDSVLQKVVIDVAAGECVLEFHAGKVLHAENENIFEPVEKFAPARLRLLELTAISCDGGGYQLNSTVVDFGAELGANESLVFYFDLTGGWDPDAFVVRLKFVAKNFSFGGVKVRVGGRAES